MASNLEATGDIFSNVRMNYVASIVADIRKGMAVGIALW